MKLLFPRGSTGAPRALRIFGNRFHFTLAQQIENRRLGSNNRNAAIMVLPLSFAHVLFPVRPVKPATTNVWAGRGSLFFIGLLFLGLGGFCSAWMLVCLGVVVELLCGWAAQVMYQYTYPTLLKPRAPQRTSTLYYESLLTRSSRCSSNRLTMLQCQTTGRQECAPSYKQVKTRSTLSDSPDLGSLGACATFLRSYSSE